MRFWELNKIKVFRIAVLLFITIFLYAILIRHKGATILGIFITALVVSIFLTSFYILNGLSLFRIAKRFREDRSGNSIIPLFDNGYTIELNNLNSKIFFTTEILKGTISGLPVHFSIRKGQNMGFVFSFSPLSKAGFGDKIERVFFFRKNLFNLYKKDVKPDVLKFVADLKAKGYAPAEE